MKKQLAVWRLIHKSLVQNIPVMLLYVLESKGSSPGRQGFFMAVNSVGEMEGSIGGGIMEHKFVEMAKEKLQASGNKERETSIKKQFHDKSATKNQSGMICSGEQTNFLYRMHLDDLDGVNRLIESLEQNKNGLLELSPAGFSFSKDIIPKENFHFVFDSDEDWIYKEKTGFKNYLYIIGGGHCSLALAKIMSMMDFFVHLIDDRQELKTFQENNVVHQKTLVDDYNKLDDVIAEEDNCYVVIMTVGYRTDDIALKALLHKNFAYLGLLGSAAKIEKMFSQYRREGIPEADLQEIHAPIGLPINSQTTEEIAISIAAEIIAVKNKKEKTGDQLSSHSEALYSGKL
jgi:xanthine dehydrogenase accessory factor